MAAYWTTFLGARETSIRAWASKTIQIASPRRNTAAPSGLRHGKSKRNCWPASAAVITTAPPNGVGSGRVGGGPCVAPATAFCLANTLTKSAPSATPVAASASSVSVSTKATWPLSWRTATDLIHFSGTDFSGPRSGAASRLKLRVSTWPSRRAPI